MQKKKIFLAVLSAAMLAACTPSIVESSSVGSSGGAGGNTSSSVQVAAKYAITVDAGEGATVTGLPAEAEEGANVTFSITLAAEKEIQYVTIDGENVLSPDANGVYSFVMPAKAVTVKAVTEDVRYENHVTQVDGATIALSSTLAKKDEVITVRVTISDESKVSPAVTVDDAAVEMALVGEAALKTFEGTFTQPGHDVNVVVALTDAPAQYAITDSTKDGAVVVGAPKAAAAGTTVHFSLALNPGFEFAGDPVVTETESGAVVEVTKVDGGYTFVMPEAAVTIEGKTAISIFKINKTVEQDLTTDLVDFAAYGEQVFFNVTETNLYAVDEVTVDGVALAKGEDGKYSFEMPSHAVAVVVKAKTRYAPIVYENSAHLTMAAYVKNEDGTYSLLPEAGATYKQQIYVKVTMTPDENGKTYGVDALKYQDAADGYAREMTLNADGYYESSSAIVDDMAYGMKFTVTELGEVFAAGATIIGSSAGFYYQNTYSYGSYTPSVKKMSYPVTVNQYGKVAYSRLYNPSNSVYNVKSYDNDAGTFAFNDYNGVYFSDGLIGIYPSGTSSQTNYVTLHLSGASELTTVNVLPNSLATNYPTSYLAELSDGTKTVYGLVEYGSTTKELSVKDITSIDYKYGTSFADANSIFYLYNGETLVGSYKNDGGVLTAFTPGEAKDYTGSLGTLHLDGICNATLTDSQGTVTSGTYSQSGTTVSVTIGEKTYTLSVDDTAGTYTEIRYAAGTYIGGVVSSSSVSYYKITTTSDFKAAWEGGSSTAVTLTSDGFTFSGKTVHLSKDAKIAFVVNGSTQYLLSMNIPSTYYSNSALANRRLLSNDSKSFVYSVYAKTLEADTISSVYYDGTNYHFGKIENNVDYSVSGTSFNFIDEDGVSYTLGNTDGKLVAVTKDEYAGTYTNSDTSSTLGNLVLDGLGNGTLGETTITYTVADSVITVKAGLTTYTITLSGTTYTVTDTVTETLPAFAGKAYRGSFTVIDTSGSDDGYSSDTTYYFYVKFSDSGYTESGSMGYDSSTTTSGSYLTSTDAAYTYADGVLTLTRTTGSSSNTCTFTYDASADTFTCTANFSYYYTSKGMVLSVVA